MAAVAAHGVAYDAAVPQITEAEFDWVRRFLRNVSGIELKAGKESLVVGRLGKRLRHHGLGTYSAYFRLIQRPDQLRERRIAVDLLTTNETYFFREPQHFDLLREILPADEPGGRPVRVWSAASSTGEEAYSIAMVLAEHLIRRQWEVVGTDLSSRVLSAARQGLYPVEAAERIAPDLLRKYCLRGKGDLEGTLAVRNELRARVRFVPANLIEPLPDVGQFDVVFLRNVMIYFANETKTAVVGRVAETLRPGGHLLIGHAESLNGLGTDLKLVRPSVYRRAGS